MSVDGNYKLSLDTPVGAQEGTMTLKADGTSLSGSLVNARGTTEFSGGSVNGARVEFDARIPTPIGRLKAHVTGRVEGGHFSGDAKLPLGSAHIEGDRLD
jgi:hypothetical protein